MSKKTNAFYNSKKWKRKREVILRRDGYLCQESKRYGKNIPADMVHHIYPLEEYPELALTNWNLVSMCHHEHNKMHDRITNEITIKGKQWQRRFKKEFSASPPT